MLIHSGLQKNEAIVYELLLKNGPMRAGAIAKQVTLKRGLVYKVLEDLAREDLVEKKEAPREVAVFYPKHPLNLKDLAERREQKARDAKLALEGVLPSIVSDFNLISGRPGVEFYEGLEGVKRVLDDTLTSHEEICAYSDIEAIDKYIPEMNKKYAERRKQLFVKKRGIVIDTPFTRDFLRGYYSKITENRFIQKGRFPFGALFQIYDEKVVYVTLEKDNFMGFILHNKAIYQMHRALYEDAWAHAKTLDQLEAGRSNAQ